jgi:hypothetical protein
MRRQSVWAEAPRTPVSASATNRRTTCPVPL